MAEATVPGSGAGPADVVRLDELVVGLQISGLVPGQVVEIVQVERLTPDAMIITYRDATGQTDSQPVYGSDGPRLRIERGQRAWSFTADAQGFLLAAEALRISLGYLFDPFLAVETSSIDPLPHQILAVYEKMLPQIPLRFLLADDPGAGKTIMAGLLCRQLMLRGDVERCLIIVPGSLVEQWQDEMQQRFQLSFTILSRSLIEESVIGNPLREHSLVIARMDQLSRGDGVLGKLEDTQWDLIIVDEAHRMSARQERDEAKRTKRYRLGETCGRIARHLLLMTATPHSGSDENFWLFLQLLDPDRFAGRAPRDLPTVGDMSRRLSKEELFTFEGRRIFPERRAYAPTYELSAEEMALYTRVTAYVQQQWNAADRLRAAGDKRGSAVGFALTTLQRRLASSPLAITRSLERRRKRLETKLEELRHGRPADSEVAAAPDFDEIDVDVDLDAAEHERLEEELVDSASAARTAEEMAREIDHLAELADRAREVLRSGTDRKWEELRGLMDSAPQMTAADGTRRKLIIFTEHRETLEYLIDRLASHLGRPETIVSMHGQMARQERQRVRHAFMNDPTVTILVATDAAGEGMNLHRAHLMVNYDLPWNPNRIEQRFGRIHRIGQEEVCHLWNLVAKDTREGEVYRRLLEKIEARRGAIEGEIFDVVGRALERPLRDLLIDAIRYGDDPKRQADRERIIDAAVGERARAVLTEPWLAYDVLTDDQVRDLRDEFKRAELVKLQPYYIGRFFRTALASLGGTLVERETARFAITNVPWEARQRGLPRQYERITFERGLRSAPGKPPAELCCPGSRLFDTVVRAVLDRQQGALESGSAVVAPLDSSTDPYLLGLVKTIIRDGTTGRDGRPQVVAEHVAFVAMNSSGETWDPGPAPLVDCRPPLAGEDETVKAAVHDRAVHGRADAVAALRRFAITTLVPERLESVRAQTQARVDEMRRAVRQRLEAAIRHWDSRESDLRRKAERGDPVELPLLNAQRAVEEYRDRLDRRLDLLEKQRHVVASEPVVIGCALVVPGGWLAARGVQSPDVRSTAEARARIERIAVDAVLVTERRLGRDPREMPHNNRGYDIESRDPTGELIHIEVKGRVCAAETVTLSNSEIMAARNRGSAFRVAIVDVPEEGVPTVHYLRHAERWAGEPSAEAVSVTFGLDRLRPHMEEPV